MKKLLTGAVLGLTFVAAAREKIIFDTDMVSDYDDVGALACLHALADADECDILAVGSCTRNNRSVAAVEIINRYYGRPDIPVGCSRGIGVDYVPQGDKRTDHEKYEWLAKQYADWVKHENSSDAPDSVAVYRKALATQPDGSVTVCSVGFLTNLRLLLESQSDAISPLNGRDLVAKKVKCWYAMACVTSEKSTCGHEYNAMKDAESSRIALAGWPTPVIFSDGAFGKDVHTGRAVAEKVFPVRNPVKDLYAHALPPRGVTNACNTDDGRSSWDQTTVLAAVRGTGKYFGLEHGRFLMVKNTYENEWFADAKIPGGRLVEMMTKKELARVIDELMCRPPRMGAASRGPAGRAGPWTKEQAWAWRAKQPWARGCNYMPASAANRVDMWQELGFEERVGEMEREFALAESIGFNALRIIVEEQGFGVWLAEHDGFMARFERTLQLMDKHKMRAIVVLGNDCSRPKELWSLPKPGLQKYDWGYHGGHKLSQHGSFPNAVGYTVMDDPDLREKFFAMCEELLTMYRNDYRILFWNLWNEPGNNNRGDVTPPYLRRMFELGWKIDPVQPLAADVWDVPYGALDDPNVARRLAGELSDVISYHCYGDYEKQVCLIKDLKRLYGRPLFNTEWLARVCHNDVFSAYPLFYLEDVGNTCWGFVAGKYQTYEPWEGMWKSVEKGGGKGWDFTKWLHDLYRPSHRPYDPREIELIKKYNAKADAESAKSK